MRKLITLSLAVAVTAALAATALAATKSVTVGDNYYVKSSGVPTVTIRSGDRVRFVWSRRASNPHNVRGIGINLGSRCRQTRESGSCRTPTLRVRRTKTYTVYCEVHGRSDQSMKLRIVR